MPEIELRMDQPSHEASFAATGAATTVDVPLAGTVLSTGHEPAPLFFVWYSSLEDELSRAAVATVQLPVGSHVITFTAKDQNDQGVPQGQLKALYQSVIHIGAAGGPPPLVESPCVVHVLAANMVAPTAATPSLSRSSPVLEAQAPLQWANFDNGSFSGMNPEYHAVNKLRYRWLFRRVGDPPGAQIELDLQNGAALALLPGDSSRPARLRFTGSLPGSLVVGASYVVTLRVEHLDDGGIAHAVARTVLLNA